MLTMLKHQNDGSVPNPNNGSLSHHPHHQSLSTPSRYPPALTTPQTQSQPRVRSLPASLMSGVNGTKLPGIPLGQQGVGLVTNPPMMMSNEYPPTIHSGASGQAATTAAGIQDRQQSMDLPMHVPGIPPSTSLPVHGQVPVQQSPIASQAPASQMVSPEMMSRVTMPASVQLQSQIDQQQKMPPLHRVQAHNNPHHPHQQHHPGQFVPQQMSAPPHQQPHSPPPSVPQQPFSQNQSLQLVQPQALRQNLPENDHMPTPKKRARKSPIQKPKVKARRKLPSDSQPNSGTLSPATIDFDSVPKPTAKLFGAALTGNDGSTTITVPSEKQAAPKQPKRRARLIHSCWECRNRKVKCNKERPVCYHCAKDNRECTWMDKNMDKTFKAQFNDMKDRVSSYERALERGILKAPEKRNMALVADVVAHDDRYETQLHPGDMMSGESILPSQADLPTADLVDVVLRISRIHLHIRTEALVLARFSSDTFHEAAFQELLQMSNLQPHTRAGTLPDFIKFSSDCVMPFTTDFLTQTGTTFNLATASLSALLPPRDICDFLVRRYYEAVHFVCPCVNNIAFHRLYTDFWKDFEHTHRDPAADVYALIYAAMFAACLSLSPGTIEDRFPKTRIDLLGTLKVAVELALDRAQWMRGLTFRSLQAVVIYLLAVCRTEISRAHSAAVGTALRVADFMGLSKDGENFRLSPSEIQQRRLVWYQLCFLDIRTSEAQGPRPALRRDDFNTKLPANLTFEMIEQVEAEAGYEPDKPPPRMPPDSHEFTPVLLSNVRFEIVEFTRAIWWDCQKPIGRRSNITEMLTQVDKFRKHVVDKYDSKLDPNNAIQRYVRLAFFLQMYRLYVVVIMRYHTPAVAPLTHKLNTVLIRSCIMIIELAIQLALTPMYSAWTWYIGAYTQYQPALLLARKVYDNPHSQEVERIWPILDFCYNTNPLELRELKIKRIMGEIVGKLKVYRELRTPTWMVDPARVAAARAAAEAAANATAPEGITLPGQAGIAPEALQGTANQPGYITGNGPPVMTTTATTTMATTITVPTTLEGIVGGLSAGSIPTTDSMVFENWSQSFQPGTGYGMSRPMVGGIASNIDWAVIENLNLFCTDPETGALSVEGYGDDSLAMQWSGVQQHGAT